MTDNQQPYVQIFYTAQWPGGAIHLRSVGVQPEEEEANQGVSDALMKLVEIWHQRFVWLVAILKFREAMAQDVAGHFTEEDRVNVGVKLRNGTTFILRTVVSQGHATKSFASREFEAQQTRAFVIYIFNDWEYAIRPCITKLLNIPDRSAVSGVLGDLRLLCNWFRHPGTNAEDEYFSRGETLPTLLSLKPGSPELTFDDAVLLMRELSNLVINVNPEKLEPLVELLPADPAFIKQIQDKHGPNATLLSW